MGVTDYLRENDSVKRYLSRLSEGSHRTALYQLHYFFSWARENSEKFGGMTPDELVKHQKEAQNGEQYEILDTLQDYIGTLEGRHATKKLRYTYPRGFFKANRAALPSDDFRINGEVPKVQGRLTLENIRDLILTSKPAYRAAFLCMFAGGMGLSEIIYWSDHGAGKLAEDLSRSPDYVRVDLPGRKKAKNIRPYYTILMGDALDSLKAWMAQRPQDAGAIFVNQYGKRFTKQSVYMYWLRHMQALGLITEGEDSSHRTGRNPHELRDQFRSQWEKSPAKGSVAEYGMGHTIDELGYNKAHLDEAWVVGEFRKAAPLLNIMTGKRPYGMVDEDEVERLRRELEEAKQGRDDRVAELSSEVQSLRELLLGALNNPVALEETRRRLARET